MQQLDIKQTEEAFLQVEKLLHGIAWKVTKKYPWLQRDEVLSEVHFLFMKALPKWKPEKAKLSSWITYAVNLNMITWITRKAKDRLVLAEINDEILEGQPDNYFRQHLSDAGKVFLDLLMDGPEEIDSINPRNILNRTVKYLRELGWHPEAIEQVIQELRTAIA